MPKVYQPLVPICEPKADIVAAVSMSLVNEYDSYDCFDPWYQEKNAWRNKSVKSWKESDIAHWICSIARSADLCPTDFPADSFVNIDGYQLTNMTERDFLERDAIYGSMLYHKLQELINLELCGLEDCGPVLTRFAETDNSSLVSEEVTPEPPVKRGRGRPRQPRRKKNTKKLGRIWEFLRDLLKNPDYCPSLIVWENYEEGMFRLVHSDRVAKLWGSKKKNPGMNYAKLSRAMRYYYKTEFLIQDGRRLVYKFGPKATNWRVDNPNFANPH